MSNNKISYCSQTYNTIKAFLYALVVYILGIIVIFKISISLHNPSIGVVGWILISSVPFLFQKKFKSSFTRKIDLEIDDTAFSAKEYSRDDVLAKEITINWADIKSYKCYFSASDMTYLVIYFRKGSNKTFSFKDEKTQEQAIKEKSVFSIFHYFVKKYNSNRRVEEQISFKPGLLTTKAGSFLLYAVIALAVFTIILHIVLQPKTSGFSFMSAFIILGLILKRKTDKGFYNKIDQLEPRNPFE